MKTATIEQPIHAIFTPLPDITAYELALLLPYLIGHPLYREKLNEFPNNVRRHIVEKVL